MKTVKFAHSVGSVLVARIAQGCRAPSFGMKVMSGAVAPNGIARSPSTTTVPSAAGAARVGWPPATSPPDTDRMVVVRRSSSRESGGRVVARPSTRASTHVVWEPVRLRPGQHVVARARRVADAVARRRLVVVVLTCRGCGARSGRSAFQARRASSSASVSKTWGVLVRARGSC